MAMAYFLGKQMAEEMLERMDRRDIEKDKRVIRRLLDDPDFDRKWGQSVKFRKRHIHSPQFVAMLLADQEVKQRLKERDGFTPATLRILKHAEAQRAE